MEHHKKGEDSRRDFIKKVGLTSCGLAIGLPSIMARNPLTDSALNDLNFGIIGFGGKGFHAYGICGPLSNIKFKAVSDISPARRDYAKKVMGDKHQINLYEDYQEMIDKEKLDAVIINTPDMWHSKQAIYCMEKGIHVYCEKTMAFNQDEAAQMVKTMRKTGMKLQLGHQRRSSINYTETFKLAHEEKILGRITNAVGQWNNSTYAKSAWKTQDIDDKTLKKYGYNSYDEYRNWRCFKSVSNGIIADLGAHQIDVFSWFFQANPHRILISGSRDYYPATYTDHEDNVFVILEYNTPAGPARASYEVISNSSALGANERIIGDKGTAATTLQSSKFKIYQESRADKKVWDDLVNLKRLKRYGDEISTDKVYVDETAPQIQYLIGKKEDFNPFTLHMKNFTDAILNNTPLTCDADEAYRCELPIFKIAQALRDKKSIITIDQKEYKV